MSYRDPEAKLAYQRNYHAANREVRNSGRRSRYAANPEHARAYNADYRRKNKEALNSAKTARYEKMRHTKEGRAALLLTSAQNRAKAKKEPCTLTLQHVRNGLDGNCPRTGVVFELQKGAGRSNPCAPSVDKIDRNKPYTDENTQIVAWAYNRMKSDMSDDELLNFCYLVVENS